jgi:hypothetical protein
MPLDSDWEKFNGGPNMPSQNRIHITINKGGIIYLNGNAHRMFGRPDAVQLFFNRKKDRIALKPAHARLKDAFPVKEKQYHYLIHASPFCLNYGIKLDGVEKFVDPDIDNEGILHLDLSTTVKVSGRKQKRRK